MMTGVIPIEISKNNLLSLPQNEDASDHIIHNKEVVNNNYPTLI